LAQKLKPLTQADYDNVQAELEVLAARTADVGNVIGPAFGAAWCDKALKLHRDILRLKMQVKDKFHKQAEMA
jgi:phage tail sheath protein FI